MAKTIELTTIKKKKPKKTSGGYKKPPLKVFHEMCRAKMGIITHIADGFNVKRGTVRAWCDKDPKFQSALDDSTEEMLDLAESKLRELIEGVMTTTKKGEVYRTIPDSTMIIFYLKTKGKKRGYIERQEVTGAEGKDLIPQIPDDELNAKIAEMERRR